MNFNNDIGSIDTIQRIDPTILPPLGGTAGVLTIVGTGGVAMPAGTTSEQPSNPVGGTLRFNTQTTAMEFFNGTVWSSLSSASGTVSSVTVTTGTGLSVSGGASQTVTSSGTFALTLNSELQALAGLSGTGLVTRTGSGTYSEVTITGVAGNTVVTNGNGVSGNPTIDLATVGTAVTNDFVKITTDGFGRVTATSAVGSGDITGALGYTPVNKAGDTMQGVLNLGGYNITNLANPVNPQDAATKNYVDSSVAGLSWKEAVIAATTTNLSATYNNGSSGVGATLTNNGTLAGFTTDGVALAVGDRVLVRQQTDNTQNGIYTVTDAGSSSTPWVLTRVTDDNTGNEMVGSAVFVSGGSTLGSTGWVQTTSGTITIGTSPIVYTQFSGAGSYLAGNGLTLTGNTFSLTTPVTVADGGTGLTSLGAADTLLSVNHAGTGIEYKTPTAGSGISIVGATGTLTFTNTGVLSITGTANQITASGSTGNVTLSLPSAITTGSLTLTSLTGNSFLYSGPGGILTSTAAPTNGQLLIGSTGQAPVAATLTAGAGISVTNGNGSITLANTGVTSVVAGTGVSVSETNGAVTVTNTGVTSVALTAPSIFSVAGSPVTSTGTLALSLTTQNANTVFAGPTSGAAAVPTFRALTYSDLPLVLYAENASGTPTAPVASGTNSIALGNSAGQTGYGSLNFASGQFGTAGDAQYVVQVLRNITTDATPTQLWLDGTAATQNLVLPANSAMTFDILVVGHRTDATGGTAGYRFLGVISKDSTAASTTFIGTTSRTVVGETNTAWDATISADTSTGSLIVTVTGEASKTIRWVATVTGARATS